MPQIDVRCANGHETEVIRPLAMYPATPVCPICSAATTQYHPPPRARWTPDPVVVFRGPDGEIRFPGDPNGLSAANYQRQGFERIELRNAAEVRRFEQHMNRREFSRAARRMERRQAGRELRESHTRGELRAAMSRMTEFGRALAREAVRRNDAKPREYAKEAGFHVEAYSNYRSNREESRDAQGRRRRD